MTTTTSTDRHDERTAHPRDYRVMFQGNPVLLCTAHSDNEALDIFRRNSMAEIQHLQRLDNGGWVWVR